MALVSLMLIYMFFSLVIIAVVLILVFIIMKRKKKKNKIEVGNQLADNKVPLVNEKKWVTWMKRIPWVRCIVGGIVVWILWLMYVPEICNWYYLSKPVTDRLCEEIVEAIEEEDLDKMRDLFADSVLAEVPDLEEGFDYTLNYL